jgi:hypothetical protein
MSWRAQMSAVSAAGEDISSEMENSKQNFAMARIAI